MSNNAMGPLYTTHGSLAHLGECIALLSEAGAEKVDGGRSMTKDEMDRQVLAVNAGISPKEFVADLLERRAKPNTVPSVADIRSTLRAAFGTEGEVFARSLESSPKGRRALDRSHEGDAA